MSEEQPGYGERDQEPTTEQTGGDPEVLEERESQSHGADSGGRAHTSPQEGHPAGEEPRSDRDVGGPTPAES